MAGILKQERGHALALEQEKERADIAEAALLRHGYRKSCDIAACNCGDQWSHGGHAERLCGELKDMIDDLKVLLTDAKKDTERLEWLTLTQAHLYVARNEWVLIKGLSSYIYSFKTPREAIDDAMRREREGK